MKIKVLLALALAVIIAVFGWLWLTEKNRATDLSRELVDAQSRAATARDELTKAGDINNHQSRQLAELNAKNTELEKDLTNRLERLEQAESAARGAERLLGTARDEVKNLTSELEQALQRAESAEIRFAELEKTADDLRQRIQLLQAGPAAPGEPAPSGAGEAVRPEVAPAAAPAEAGSLRFAYETMLRDLEAPLNRQELTISEDAEKLSLTFMEQTLFSSGSAAVTPAGVTVLDAVAAALKSLGDKKITVIGHTDDQPIDPQHRRMFPSNWELSAARAGAVIRYFEEKGGLPPENLEAIGRAHRNPAAPNDTPENRQKNRRVEIVVSHR